MTKINESSELLTWKIHMARKNASRAISVFILILICAYFVFITLEDPLLTFASVFVLIMMVLPYYLPVTYVFTEDGITKKMFLSKQSRKWTEFHRYKTDKNNILLYTLKKESRLDNYRSFLILCDKNKEQVLEIVEKKITKNTSV